jgi:DNA-binding MarR family transcriptional regulator
MSKQNASRPEQLEELQQLFLQLFRAKAQQWGKYVEQGISGSQAHILELLHNRGKQRASDLAVDLNVTTGAVTSLSDKLISGGYASRERCHEDRRVVYLAITRHGEEMLAAVAEKRKEITELFYGQLSPEDMDHLIRIYTQVLQRIKSKGDR